MSEEAEASAAVPEAEAAGESPPDAAGGEEGESPPEKMTELAPPRETFPGDCPQEDMDRLLPICANTEQKYQLVITSLRQIKESESIVQRFHAREGKLTPIDVEKAKKQFHKAKQSYIQAGNEINEGIKQVNDLAQTYPEDLLLKETFKTYLAKLLASLETRNPPEPMVSWLAAANFHFERKKPELDEREQQRGLTVEKKKLELLESEARYVNMLETRYLKRQLQNRLRQGENKSAIVGHVGTLLKRDPEDLHTYIWLARLKYENYEVERNQNTRLATRDEILGLCKLAFSLIDDFMTLQRINDQNERDRRRASYVRTITDIRKPLM